MQKHYVCLQLSAQLLQNSWVNHLDADTEHFSSHQLAPEIPLQALPLTASSLCYLKQAEWDQDLQLQ